jgi:hypothetical protein
MINWALYGVLCVQICENNILKFRCPTNSRVDVYSYSFIDDRHLLKLLGNSSSLIRYFVFLLETV